MSILPTYEAFTVPVLAVLSDGQARSSRELRIAAAAYLHLDDTQRAERLPSGGSRLTNRVGWALNLLRWGGAIERIRRAEYAITPFGIDLLSQGHERITERQLRAIAGVSEAETLVVDDEGGETTLDPTEQVEQGIRRITDEVSAELLDRLRGRDPAFFEEAVVKLLLAMGYGGVGGQGVTTSLHNDGGIDGIIDQDVLGLSKVYVQAKRYAQANAVQRPEVQGFVGALSGKADGGVFITTSRFSPGAAEWVRTVPARIILIDGQRLAELMIEYGVGVQVERIYRVVEIDEDFFT